MFYEYECSGYRVEGSCGIWVNLFGISFVVFC